MRQKEFERELEQRLTENKQLWEHPFLPKEMVPVVVFVANHLFYLAVIAAFLLTVASFLISDTFGLAVSRRILLL
ncbi:MAG: hypothetical protein HYS86_05015 [Candidatus Chisholmbacteria bacterium]|nr:hypothetical protein [Candidatus Chisholmbacteria bacterium]